jgi:dolichol-phosphate mannosyltransferase
VLVSVVVPAHNEVAVIDGTLRALHESLRRANIDHEIILIDDHSTDGTADAVQRLASEIPSVRLVTNTGRPGFGLAVRTGLRAYKGDAVAIFMADASDDPEDLVRYVQVMEREDVDCVFGSRFVRGSSIIDYPRLKLVFNRLANSFIKLLFGLRFNDVSNAFKLYRRDAIEGMKPFLSHHFNLTVEMPLKAIVRGYSFAVVPISWTNRKEGVSKFRVQEMGSRYLFIVLYCFLERWLARGDYTRPTGEAVTGRATVAPKDQATAPKTGAGRV